MNYQDNNEIQDLESSIEGWMLGDRQNATESLGEDVVSAVAEVLDYEQ